MTCVVCRARAAAVGLLCEDCRDDLPAPRQLVPQQLVATVLKPTGDALIDQWGRPHGLEAHTLIGRAVDGAGILILEASVSRHHAHLVRDRDGEWSLRDLGSSNGTLLNDQPVEGAVPVRHGDRIAIGSVGFVLVTGLGDVPPVEVDPGAITTARSRGTAPDQTTESPVPDMLPYIEREDTDVGLPAVELRLIEPTGGGGGYLELGGTRVQLTPSQLELVAILARRMREEADQPSQVRGFVRSSELIATLSWDTHDPDENHVKQLVRRVRRLLVRDGVGELIESRHRFGYRLRVIPRDT
jgi:pSer/pThr/pTyr-binding forkhead associated (FHA) protein